MENKNLMWKILGILFITIVGSMMHFLFEWSGYNPIIGAFSAVNESVWEHNKLAFFPLVIFSLIEYNFLKREVNNYFFSKFIAAIILPAVIIIFFYSYTAILGDHVLFLDIFSFILAIIIAELVSFQIERIQPLSDYLKPISLIGIIIIGFLFVLFTYLPPQIPLFQDGVTGEYGIVIHSFLL